jgi:hypothetical protein
VSKFHFEIELLDHGWARLNARQGDMRAQILASYRHDSLAETIEALTRLTEGADERLVTYLDDGCGTQWRLVRKGDRCCYEWVFFQEPFLPNRRAIETRLGCGEEALARVIRAVYAAMTALLNQHGADEYARQWRHPFPADEMKRLQESLARGRARSTQTSTARAPSR